MSDPQAPIPPSTPPARSVTTRVIETTQTVLLALALAFIFRAFFVEPFIIPTGSMAESLLGVHTTRLCPACGWEYNVASAPTDRTGGRFVRPASLICPNCGLRLIPTADDTFGKAGDRVLVHKWAYALGGAFAPRRWDVVVFRDPSNPDQHYIKRLVGLPGESVELLDGDVYIDGHIARKPPAVQAGLWTIVFDQSYLPRATATSGDTPRWLGTPVGTWTGTADRVLRAAAGDEWCPLRFNPQAAPDYLLDFSGYNGHSSGAFVGDVRLVAEITRQGGDGALALEIARPPVRYVATLRPHEVVVEEAASNGDRPTELVRVPCAPLPAGYPVAVEFGYVDQRVFLRVDGRDLVPDAIGCRAVDPADVRTRASERPARLALRARQLRLEVRGLRVDRDVYYTVTSQTLRAYPGRPFQLRAGEHFVLGDNSADSFDSREWTDVGPHLPPGTRPGTVRADQIVGQAAFVYLPGLLPADRGSYRVPDVGRVRFVR